MPHLQDQVKRTPQLRLIRHRKSLDMLTWHALPLRRKPCEHANHTTTPWLPRTISKTKHLTVHHSWLPQMRTQELHLLMPAMPGPALLMLH
jgi:hypothetical protein